MIGFIGLLIGLFSGQLLIYRLDLGFGFWSFVIQLIFLMAFANIFIEIERSRKK